MASQLDGPGGWDGWICRFHAEGEPNLIARELQLTEKFCSHTPVAALLPTRMRQGLPLLALILTIPLFLGHSARFIFSDILGEVLVLPMCIVTGEMGARWMAGQEEKEMEKKKEKKKKKKKKSGYWSTILAALNSIVIGLIVVGSVLQPHARVCLNDAVSTNPPPPPESYPIAVMPFYRASSTNDGLRLVFVCFFHPIVHELTMTIQRFQSGRSHLLDKTINDPDRWHFPMAALGGVHFLEAVFIMFRRLMLGVVSKARASSSTPNLKRS